jgi:hypothetical protein
MEKIEVEIRDFDNYSVYDILNYKYGVYIIWDSRAKKYPTYIGEGDVMKRLCDHRNDKEYAMPINGYIANIYHICKNTKDKKYDKWRDEIPEKDKKKYSQLLEYVFLWIAEEANIPIRNISSGSLKALKEKFSKGNRKIDIILNGTNPFKSRGEYKQLKKGSKIEIEKLNNSEPYFKNKNWKKIFKL